MQGINANELANQICELQRLVSEYDGSYITVVQACTALKGNTPTGYVTADQAFAALKGGLPAQKDSTSTPVVFDTASLAGKVLPVASKEVSDVIPDHLLDRVRKMRESGMRESGNRLWYCRAPN